MLTIKLGLAIHAEYTFSLKNSSGSVLKTAGFVNNVIHEHGMRRFGDAVVFTSAEVGVSPNINVGENEDVVMPVNQVRMDQVNPTHTTQYDPVNKRLNLNSKYILRFKNFKVPAGSTLNISEFGIKGLNRILLKDIHQNLNGFEVGSTDVLEVEVSLNFLYYTNNLVNTLGENAFGTRVDYSSEVILLPDAYLPGIKNHVGYSSNNLLDIFPITQDIREVETSKVEVPRKDDYQQVSFKTDRKAYRSDTRVIGYCKEQTRIYGFVLRDNSRDIGVLVRFLTPVTIERNKRYQVGGFVIWGPVVGGVDEGFTLIDLDNVEETVEITAGIPPVYQNLVNGQIDAVTQYNQNVPYTVKISEHSYPQPPTYESITTTDTFNLTGNETPVQINQKFGEKGYAGIIFSKAPPDNTPSTLDYIRPTESVHNAALPKLIEQVVSEDGTTLTALLPISVVGGDYIDGDGTNQWRIDCYFPYMSESFNYLGYGFAGYEKAKYVIDLFSENDATALELGVLKVIDNRTGIEDVNSHYAVRDLVGGSISTDRGVVLLLPQQYRGENVDPTLVSDGVTYETTLDYDTPIFSDWVVGETKITQNNRFLDIRPNVISDASKNVTEFKVTFDSLVHKLENASLFVGFQGVVNFVTNFDNHENLETALNANNFPGKVDITKEVVGTKTIFTFKRPYHADGNVNLDLFITGNEKIMGHIGETAYIKIVEGSHGYRVFNKSASDITNSLYLEENAFLAAGVRLYHPMPDNMFKYRVLTTAEAALYYNDPSITGSLSTTLFTLDFVEDRFKVNYQQTIDHRSTLLNGDYLYPAIGFDISKITDTIDDNDVLFRDAQGQDWTKQSLLNLKITSPEKIIDGVYYFVYPIQIKEGLEVQSYTLTSSFYGQEISLDTSVEATLSYIIETATITPDPINILTTDTIQAQYSYTPTEAKVNSVEWSTLDPLIAIVDSVGRVSGRGVGQTTLRLILNEQIIATATVNVMDPDITISCDGAPNITDCMALDGTQLDLTVNDQPIATTVSDETIYTYFRDNDAFRIVNCLDLTEPGETLVIEAGFMELGGQHDLYIQGTLIGKDMTYEEIIQALENDPRLIVIREVE